MTDTAAAQLRRILHIIPQLAEDREIPLSEVAEKVGVSPAVLLKDFKSLTERFDTGAFSDGLSLFIDESSVTLNSNHFRRPMRLTRSELRALELGLAMLRVELPPDDRAVVESAREKIQKVVVKLPPDSEDDESYYLEAGADHTGALPVLRNAFAKHQKARILYHKGDAEKASERIICPWSFVVANGRWYVIAYCDESDGVRVFRLDRVRQVTTTDESYVVPESFRVGEFTSLGRAFSNTADRSMKVRYSAKVARWIAEREDGEEQADGSLVVEHPLADDAWGIRHVLQYGGEAEILEPQELRNSARKTIEVALRSLPDDS